MRLLTMVLLLCSLGEGCTMASDYGRVYSKLTETRRQLRDVIAEREAEVDALQARLDAVEKREAALASSEGRLQIDISASGEEIEALRAAGSLNTAAIDELTRERGRLRTQLDAVAKDRAQLKQGSDKMRAQLKTLSARQAQADAQALQYKRLLEQFKTMIDAGSLRVKVEYGRMVLELPSDVLFASGSASLSESGRIALHQVAGVLRDVDHKTFQVEGHTDNVPIANEEFHSNWHLASARALTVVETLLTAGMAPQRLSAASFSEYRPVRSNRRADGKAANRRIEIVLVPDLTDVPDAQTLEGATSRSAPGLERRTLVVAER